MQVVAILISPLVIPSLVRIQSNGPDGIAEQLNIASPLISATVFDGGELTAPSTSVIYKSNNCEY